MRDRGDRYPSGIRDLEDRWPARRVNGWAIHVTSLTDGRTEGYLADRLNRRTLAQNGCANAQLSTGSVHVPESKSLMALTSRQSQCQPCPPPPDSQEGLLPNS